MQTANTLAVVDRVIGKLKVILSGYSLTDWSAALKKATDAYNEKSHSYLMGSSPDDVKGSNLLQYELDKVHGEQIKHNNDKWRAKAAKLRDAGAFRVPRPRETWERIDAPKFKGEVHEVALLKGANVEDTEGRSYPVRKVLAVPAGSAGVEINEELIPGSGRREQQVKALKKYSEALKQEMSTTQGSMTLVRVRMFLKSRPQFEDTAELVRLPKAGRYIKFLRLFGYQITGSGPGMTVRAPRAPPVAGRVCDSCRLAGGRACS